MHQAQLKDVPFFSSMSEQDLAGDFFGEIALIREERRTATVTATSPMVLVVMKGSSFRSLDRSTPEIRETVSKVLAERY